MTPGRRLPAFARVLLALRVRAERRAEAAQDLAELFAARCACNGRRRATWRLLADVLSLYWRPLPSGLGRPTAHRARRDAGVAFGQGWWADLRVACREWRRAPVRTAASIGCLVVGLSTSIVAFSVVNAWVAGDIPGIRDRDTLMRVMVNRGHEGRATRDEARAAVTMSWETLQLASQSRSDGVVEIDDALASVELHDVSGGLFEVLGTTPAAGRLLQPADDQASAAPAAVISHTIWQRRFGGEPVIGTPIAVTVPSSGQPARTYTIVGVAPADFVGVEQRNYGAGNRGREIVWITSAHAMPERRDGRGESLDVWLMARLHAPATVAAEELAGRRLDPTTGRAASLALRPYFFAPVTDVEDIVTGGLALMSVPFAILLIVGVNVASLRLAAAAGRSHELAVRASLGASRWRLVRLLSLETLAATAVASMVSWLIAGWVLARGLASGLPVALDVRVAGFAVVLAGCAALLAGVWPALRATGAQLRPIIDRAASGLGGGTPRLHSWLVTGQMAVSLVLLVFGSLVVKGLFNLQPGDVAERVAPLGAVSFGFVDPTVDAAGRLAAIAEIARRVAGLPGVEHVALASGRGVSFESAYVELMSSGTRPVRLSGAAVSPSFLDTWAIPVLQGRGFGPSDPPDVAVVTRSLQEALSPGGSVIGSRIGVHLSGETPREATVVGVIDDFIGSIGFRPSASPEPRVFLPFDAAVAADVTVFTRSARPETILPAVAEVVRAAPTPLLVGNAMTMSEAVIPRGPLVALAGLMGGAGAFALAVAALGLWAVTSLGVARRQREFGIRLAIGGRPSTVLRLMLRDTARVIVFAGVAGAVIGTPILFAMRGEMIGVEVWDPVAIVVAFGTLAAAALAAAVGPALQAARVNPIEVLRGE